MRRAGRVVAEMHGRIREALRPGVTTLELVVIGRDVLDRRGAQSNFLGYHGYPAVICTSPNDVIVHGIPDDTVLVDGDIVSIDCGAIVGGYHGDAAFTAPVGDVGSAGLDLIAAGRLALDAAIAVMCDGNRLGDIGFAVQSTAEPAGYGVVREYTGHGIGTAMHENPAVPNVGSPGKGLRLKTGMVLAVEPMLCERGATTTLDGDGWTVRTADGGRAVHWEHTIAITDDGPEILTLP